MGTGLDGLIAKHAQNQSARGVNTDEEEIDGVKPSKTVQGGKLTEDLVSGLEARMTGNGKGDDVTPDDPDPNGTDEQEEEEEEALDPNPDEQEEEEPDPDKQEQEQEEEEDPDPDKQEQEQEEEEEDPVPEGSVKVGDKVYTKEELAELRKQLGVEDAPAAKPAEPEKPKEPTPEEIEARKKEFRTKQENFLKSTREQLAQDDMYTPQVSEEDVDAILEGGEGAVKALQNILANDRAATLMAARQSIMPEVLEYADKIGAQVKPLAQAHEQQTVETTAKSVAEAYPALADYDEVVTQVYNLLQANHADEVAKLSPQQLVDEIAEHAGGYIAKVNKGFDYKAKPAPKPAVKKTARKKATPPPSNTPRSQGKGGPGTKKAGGFNLSDKVLNVVNR